MSILITKRIAVPSNKVTPDIFYFFNDEKKLELEREMAGNFPTPIYPHLPIFLKVPEEEEILYKYSENT